MKVYIAICSAGWEGYQAHILGVGLTEEEARGFFTRIFKVEAKPGELDEVQHGCASTGCVAGGCRGGHHDVEVATVGERFGVFIHTGHRAPDAEREKE